MNLSARNHPIAAYSACWLAALCAALLFTACAAVPRGAALYQSDQAVIYRLAAATTPAALAQRFLADADKAWVVTDNNPGSRFSAGEVVTIPLKNENRGGLYEDGVQVVPILCYHRFGDSCESNLCVSRETFAAQLEYLKQNDYHVISLAQLTEFLEYRAAIPAKSVVITIDDGYRSIYDIAYPLLKQYRYPATLFIYTDFIQATSMAMTWDQVRRMKADGFEIGSHSITHADLTLKKNDEDEGAFLARVTAEIVESKKIIDQELNQDTVFFAFPYGIYNQLTVELSQKAGYRLGLGIQNGGNPFFADPLTLRRNQILSEDMDYFSKRIKTRQPISLKVSHAN